MFDRINYIKTIRKKTTQSGIFLLVLSLISIISLNFYLLNLNDIEKPNFHEHNDSIFLSDINNSTLFSGNENPLTINESGYLYAENQEVTLSENNPVNLSYYLDEEHDWKGSKVELQFNKIKDERDWVANGSFQETQVFTKNLTTPLETYPNYSNNHPYTLKEHSIYQSGAIAIRVHFVNISFENEYDYLVLTDQNSNIIFIETGYIDDFYTTWVLGDTVNISYYSDGSIPDYGYYIDRYEYMNSSSNYYINENSWGENSFANFPNSNSPSHGPGYMDDQSAMNVRFIGIKTVQSQMPVTYYQGEYSAIYQNITLQRGPITGGYISFDYYPEFIIESNELAMYCAINDQEIYNKGFRNIVEDGRREWHSTGKIDMDLWINTTNLFNNSLDSHNITFSLGILSGGSVSYSGFEERFQQSVWFDNVSLVLETFCNTTQEDINLTINNQICNPGDKWGSGSINIDKLFESNPIIVTINTNSPSLSFNLNTTVNGYHIANTTIEDSLNFGSNYQIHKNGSVYWEFYHNFYMPSEYSDFEILIEKPKNWELLAALDPTLQEREFQGGKMGQNYILINKSETLYPGWWKFIAKSPNYISYNNTDLYCNGFLNKSIFRTNEIIQITTQINHSNNIPNNVNLTYVKLKIYHPNETLWYEESINPMQNGNVSFSEITMTQELQGGVYEYNIFWSNGTDLGGIYSNFTLIHNASMILFKPDDAIQDFQTEGFIGDLIPLRFLLIDEENNRSLTNVDVKYNYTNDTPIIIQEAAAGLYETAINTEAMNSGINIITITSDKLGYDFEVFTLTIYLVENTKLQRLESEYYIELHSNITISFKYSTLNNQGIQNANISIGIEESQYYQINHEPNGVYTIDIDTHFINFLGPFQINMNFSKESYEAQNYLYQFELVEQPVNLLVEINQNPIISNSLISVSFNDVINISASARAFYDGIYLNQGEFEFISGSYSVNLSNSIGNQYNLSLICTTTNFNLGINYVYLRYTQENYSTTIFEFQLLVNQINLNISSINFGESISAEAGTSKLIQIQIRDSKNNDLIHGANISYYWDFGIGFFDEAGNHYEMQLTLPDMISGNYELNIIVSVEGGIYKTTQQSFLITSPVKVPPNYLLWIISIVLLITVGILGALSVRSYILIPRKKRKRDALLSKAQRFKDIQNIQAIVVIHKLSGIPIYTKSYSLLAKNKKALFSGFIQAIIQIGEEISKDKEPDNKTVKSFDSSDFQRFVELDFKIFHCIIADRDDLRIVFILNEVASERLKSQLGYLITALCIKMNQRLENWDGRVDDLEITVPSIINEYFELYYKEPFKMTSVKKIAQVKGQNALNSMELRAINVISSMTKSKESFLLKNVIRIIHEEDKNKVIIAIESLIDRKLIVPVNDSI